MTSTTKTWSINTAPWLDSRAQPRKACRVIIDNDFAGDPDDLFQLVHHLLSETADIRLIVCSHLRAGDFLHSSPRSAADGRKRVETLLGLLGARDDNGIVVTGSELPLADASTPRPSEACDAIIREAMRDDTDLPLYYVAGGGVTDLISAALKEPAIAGRMSVVWIGGQEYPGFAQPPLGRFVKEYNAEIDPVAARALLCDSAFPLWQVPRDAYRQCLVSVAQLRERLRPLGPLGAFLLDEIDRIRFGERYGTQPTGAYCLGDSPLVGLTVLQTPWDTAPASCRWFTIDNDPGVRLEADDRPLPPCVTATDQGRVHVVTHVDTWLLFEDLYAKLAAFGRWLLSHDR